MNIQRMHSEIKLRWNKINSNHKKDLPSAFIDDFINDATNEFIEICYAGNNYKKFRLGFEITQQRVDLVSTLVVPEKTINAVLFKSGIYKFNLTNITPSYKHYLRSFANTSCGKVNIETFTHNELDSILQDANMKPSMLWRRAVATFKSDGTGSALYVYTNGEFTITSIELEYLRQPAKVFFGGYDTYEYTLGDTSFPNNGSAPISSDLPEIAHTYIVDIAVDLIARSLEDVNKLQLVEDKLLKTL